MKTHRSSTTTATLRHASSAPEALESRVVPAAVFSFVESDGDLVQITSSLGTDADLTAAVTLAGGNDYIAQLDLTAAVFADTDLRVIATPGGVAGDGFINVGFLNATNNDLGKVKIDGDLDKIVAGDAIYGTAGIDALRVQSLGKFDTSTGAPDLSSLISGDVGVINVATDVRAATLNAFALAGVGGNITSLTIGGSLIGTVANGSGAITADGNIAKVTIGGSLIGGEGEDSAKLTAGGDFGVVKIAGTLLGAGERSARIIGDSIVSLTVGGNICGGLGEESGSVQVSGGIGRTRIDGSLLGGLGNESARIQAGGELGSIVIGGNIAGSYGDASASILSTGGEIGRLLVRGSLVGGLASESGKASAEGFGLVRIFGDLLGGHADNTGKISAGTGGIDRVIVGGSVVGRNYQSVAGTIFTNGDLGVLRIGGDLIGGNAGGADSTATGYIRADNIGDVMIGGSIIAGSDTGGGALEKSGSIRANDRIGRIVVGGEIVGNATQSVIISAEGLQGAGVNHTAIGALLVAGNAQYLQVLAGYDINGVASDGDSSIGAVRIGGDVRAVDLVAGINGGGDGFGNGNDAPIAFSDPAVLSRIANVVILGQVVNSTNPVDNFGIVAQEVIKLRLRGHTVTLNAGPGNDVIALGTVSDATLREI